MILCPVDHPLVSASLVAELIEEFDASGKLIVLPTYRGKRGHPVIFRAALYDEMLAAAPEVGAGPSSGITRRIYWKSHGGRRRNPESERSRNAKKSERFPAALELIGGSS